MTRDFHEGMRYDLNLTADSVVLDIGCYHGTWSRLISEKYNCRVIAFEPIGEFYRIAKKALEPFPKVRLFNLGVGGSTRKEILYVKGDMTGQFSDGKAEECDIRDIVEILEEAPPVIDALKINAEGHEFEILERLLFTDMIRGIRHLSVQPHACVPDFEARWQRIMDRLAETHEVTYYCEWTWYGATRRT